MTVEGPLGGARRGSWLISGRKSYLDLIVRKLREEGLSFGFADAQAKLRHDVGTNHSAALTFLVGKSRLRELPQQVEDNELFTGDNASAIGIGSWRTALRRGVFTAGLLGATNRFRNHILTGIDREKGGTDHVAARSDLTLRLVGRLTLESGSWPSTSTRRSASSASPARRSPFSTTIAPTRRGRARTRGCDSTLAAA